MSRDLLIFALAVAGLGIATGIHETSFNNYLSDVFSISTSARGFLEFPRELPGLLAVFIAGALISLGLIRVAALSMAFLALGLFGLGFLSLSVPTMVVWLIIWSIGNHLFMPLEGSIAVGLAKENSIGEVLGKLGSIRLATTILGAGIIWFGFGSFLQENLTYRHTYLAAAVIAIGSVIALMHIRPLPAKGKQTKLVWRSDYKIYYWLSLLWGVRKQIFITFAPWLLVQTFDQPASIIAQLWIVTSIIGVFFRPFLGKLSDTFGERALLLGEIPITICLFMGYAFSPFLEFGVYIVFVCFVIDSQLSALTMVRTSYVSKILENENDLAPTLAMGVSLDHVSAMIMPIFGGFLWATFGSPTLFLSAIVFILINAFFANQAVVPKDVESAAA